MLPQHTTHSTPHTEHTITHPPASASPSRTHPAPLLGPPPTIPRQPSQHRPHPTPRTCPDPTSVSPLTIPDPDLALSSSPRSSRPSCALPAARCPPPWPAPQASAIQRAPLGAGLAIPLSRLQSHRPPSPRSSAAGTGVPSARVPATVPAGTSPSTRFLGLAMPRRQHAVSVPPPHAPPPPLCKPASTMRAGPCRRPQRPSGASTLSRTRPPRRLSRPPPLQPSAASPRRLLPPRRVGHDPTCLSVCWEQPATSKIPRSCMRQVSERASRASSIQ